MKRHALFVGVDQYTDGHIPNLSCAVSDATDLHGFFKFGAGYDRVELLQNPAVKQDILDAVQELTSGLKSGDFFLFFFAGHGFRVGENHILVCNRDGYDDVKHEDAGLRLGQLKRRLSGSFDTALFLDACQSDILQTRGGEGIAERDLSLIHETRKDEMRGGTLTIVTSCDAGQTAAELSEARHGLFTMAMLDLLESAQGSHTRLDLSDTFRINLGRRMGEIAARSGLSTEQRPRFSCTGDSCFILLDGVVTTSAEQAIVPSAGLAQLHAVCPFCGKHALITETFKCMICGQDHICSNHFSTEYNCCEACAEKKINTKKALKAYNEDDFDLAYELMQKGDNTSPEGQFVMAVLNEVGCRYFDDDSDKAVEWFRKAAEQGYAEAQFKLADYFSCGCSVEENPSEAYNWYLKAARQGHVEAQYFVGWCFETGFGVDKDADSAFLWYQRAAERGWASAQCSLGRLYANGEGAEEDAEEAVKWYRKAAEQGNDEAQYYLGECYYRGDGVEESEDEAIKWYRLAADQGNGDAQERLDELDPQETEDNGSVEESDDEERTVERDDADAMKRKTLPLRLDEAFPTENCVEVNLVEGGVSGGDRFGRYCGPMENGKPHGTGRFMSSSGYVYTGVFFNGVRSGRGKIEYKDGATYEGGFYEGEWSGEGTYTWPNGTQHVGQFRNGKFHGPGRQINPDGTSFTGNWEYGKLIAYT